jgi:hypothetical protein
MSLTKLSLAGNNLIIPRQGDFREFSDIPAGNGKPLSFFYSVAARCELAISRACAAGTEAGVLVTEISRLRA